jgi:hypothetical protein
MQAASSFETMVAIRLQGEAIHITPNRWENLKSYNAKSCLNNSPIPGLNVDIILNTTHSPNGSLRVVLIRYMK